MSLRHLHRPTGGGEAYPEAVTSISAPEPPQTRKENDTTERITHTRRRVILALLGAGGLVATSGAGAALVHYLDQDQPSDSQPDTGGTKPETGPAFEKDLTLATIKLPETLTPPTFAELFANVGQAIQYDVNYGRPDDLAHLIPGGRWGELQPGQFQLRADFLQGYRQSSQGTAADRPDNPEDPRYYAWGFSIKMLEQLTAIGSSPQDPKLLDVAAQVQITIGDLPSLVTQTARPLTDIVEPRSHFTTNLRLTRVMGVAGDNYVYIPNMPGQDGYGWGIAAVDNMQEVPSIMKGANLPPQFPTVPPLWAK